MQKCPQQDSNRVGQGGSNDAPTRSLQHARCFLLCRARRCQHRNHVYGPHQFLSCLVIQKYAIIFVAYVYDLNAIIVRAMPTRTNAAVITAFNEVIEVLRIRGYHPALNVMDNKCSTAVERYIQLEKINIQLVPPHNHRANAAE